MSGSYLKKKLHLHYSVESVIDV